MAEIVDEENPLVMDLGGAITNAVRRSWREKKEREKAAMSPEEKARRKEEKAERKAEMEAKYRRKLEKANDPERQAKRARRRARRRREAEERARQEAEKKLKDDVSAVKPGEAVKDPKGTPGKGFLAVLRKAQDVRNTAVSPSIPDSTKVASVSKGGKDESLVANLRNNLQGRS